MDVVAESAVFVKLAVSCQKVDTQVDASLALLHTSLSKATVNQCSGLRLTKAAAAAVAAAAAAAAFATAEAAQLVWRSPASPVAWIFFLVVQLLQPLLSYRLQRLPVERLVVSNTHV